MSLAQLASMNREAAARARVEMVFIMVSVWLLLV